MNSPVEILLSTYNGERFLAVQLDSILKQEYTNWKLLIRDDGSKDGTLAIITEYIKRFPDKISLHEDTDGNLGFSGSFVKLLKQSSADYVMFCDQDDCWHPSKIATMLSAMLQEETRLPGRAQLIFSDLEMANVHLDIVHPSFLKKMGYVPDAGMQVFFLKNYVPGCNMLFNRKLIELALKTDNILNLHDHWLLMVCCATGNVTFVDKPLMLYRMHDNNTIGFFLLEVSAFSQFMLFFKNSLKYGLSNRRYRTMLYSRNILQMQNICKNSGFDVSIDAVGFSKINRSNYVARKIRNMVSPYMLETSLFKQLTYIICF